MEAIDGGELRPPEAGQFSPAPPGPGATAGTFNIHGVKGQIVNIGTNTFDTLRLGADDE
jgi:hypothetical protein